MEGGSCQESEARFAGYVEALGAVLGHADRQQPMHDYCLGLLMPIERKSVEPMAAVAAPAQVAAKHQSLLHFVGNAPWSDAAMLDKVAELVLPAIERSGPATQRRRRSDPNGTSPTRSRQSEGASSSHSPRPFRDALAAIRRSGRRQEFPITDAIRLRRDQYSVAVISKSAAWDRGGSGQ